MDAPVLPVADSIYCPQCKKKIVADVAFCPQCGSPTNLQARQAKEKYLAAETLKTGIVASLPPVKDGAKRQSHVLPVGVSIFLFSLGAVVISSNVREKQQFKAQTDAQEWNKAITKHNEQVKKSNQERIVLQEQKRAEEALRNAKPSPSMRNDLAPPVSQWVSAVGRINAGVTVCYQGSPGDQPDPWFTVIVPYIEGDNGPLMLVRYAATGREEYVERRPLLRSPAAQAGQLVIRR